MKRPARHPYLYWMLLLLALSGLAWLWWQAAKGPANLSVSSAPVPVPVPGRSRPLATNQLSTLNSQPSTSRSLPTNPPPLAQAKSPAVTPLTNTLPPAVSAPVQGTALGPSRSFATNQPSASNQLATLNSQRSTSPSPGDYPRPVQDLFEMQVALARQGISPGSLDGLMGSQTRAAIRAFQRKERLPQTGELDPPTRERLLLTTPPLTSYTITAGDQVRLRPLSRTWLGKSQQNALDYETLLELVAEKTQAHPKLLLRLNAALDWAALEPGTTVQVPDVPCLTDRAKAAFLAISLAGKTLEAFDAQTNLLVHCPCSIAQRVEKRPVGELYISVIAPNPNYTFDPAIFPESAEARRLKNKLILKPGPNNPVGVAWIGLSKPGYGIHGTPNPEQVGRTESHGCFRLANWNAARLVGLVWVGMPVYVQP